MIIKRTLKEDQPSFIRKNKKVLKAGDVLEVEIVDNIGAKLATEQALADKHVAEARAEAKRAEAVATGQEMKARKKGMKAQLVYSKSSLPNAMAEALREGNVGNKTGAGAKIREN